MAINLNYIKSMDGMRGFFALVIIIGHWSLGFPIAPIGWEILQIFFVLSGFLITRILLYERDKVDAKPNGTFRMFYKSFITKRAYRIFPLYFGYIFLTYVLRYGLGDIKFFDNATSELDINGIWLWTYLYNFKDIFNPMLGWQMPDTLFFTHLWSLSLEEQFYVFFPLIIYFLRGRALKTTIIAMIVIPFFIRLLGYPYLEHIAEANNFGEDWAILIIYRNIFFQFDSLALGAALVIFDVSKIKQPRLWFYAFLAIIVGTYAYYGYTMMQIVYEDTSLIPEVYKNGNSLSFVGLINILGHPEILKDNNMHKYMFTVVNFASFFMILCSIQGKSILKFIFHNDVMVYLGKISYGTYVYHLGLMQFFFFVVKKYAFIPAPDQFIWLQILYFIIYMAILYFIAHLSFKYFESYFLKLKSKVK